MPSSWNSPDLNKKPGQGRGLEAGPKGPAFIVSGAAPVHGRAIARGGGACHISLMPLYFAYGSNMDRAAMAARCPSSRLVGLARLPRHRFLITVDGYASVVRDPRREVHGVVWDLALSDVPPLDRYESLHTGLYSKISQPVVMQGGARRALIYIGRTDKAGKPKPGYLESVIAAARDCGLPESYIYELQHGEPAPRKPGAPLFRAPM